MQESSSRPSRGGNSAPLPIRRRSAQELITLYELTDQITRAPESSKKRIQLTAPFHNLLGVFGKKGKKTHTEGHSKSPSRSRSPSPPGRKPLPAIPDTPRTIVPAKEDNPLGEASFLYLQRGTSPPTWRECIATLQPRAPKLLLLFPSNSENGKESKSIALQDCVEVRSVAANQIEPSMSPTWRSEADMAHISDTKDKTRWQSAHVFELEMRTGVLERFAVSSVKERGCWVSAIWDAILLCRQPMMFPTQSSMTTSTAVDDGLLTKPPLRVVNVSRLSGLSIDVPASRAHFSLQDEGYSRASSSSGPTPQGSIFSPPYSASTAPSTPRRTRELRPDSTSSLPSSPSIRTLDSLTLVQQRLADLERRQSSDSFTRKGDFTPEDLRSPQTPSRRQHSSPFSRENTPTRTVFPQVTFSESPPRTAPPFVNSPYPVSIIEDSLLATPSPSTGNSSSTEPANSASLTVYKPLQRSEENVNTPRIDATGRWDVAEKILHGEVDEGSETSVYMASLSLSSPRDRKDTMNSTTSRDIALISNLPDDKAPPQLMLRDHLPPARPNSIVRTAPLDFDVKLAQEFAALRESHNATNAALTGTLNGIGNDVSLLVEQGILKTDLTDINSALTSLLSATAKDTGNHSAILAVLDEIKDGRAMNSKELSVVVNKLELLIQNNKHKEDNIPTVDFGTIMDGLDDLKALVSKSHSSVVSPSSSAPSTGDLAGSNGDEANAPNLTSVLAKLEEIKSAPDAHLTSLMASQVELTSKIESLAALCHQIHETGVAPKIVGDQTTLENVALSKGSDGDTQPDIVALLKDAQEHRAALTNQQADSVRYLHELNQWLEKFVNQGTGQMESMSVGIANLCKELSVPSNIENPEAPSGSQQPTLGALVADVRTLLMSLLERGNVHVDLTDTMQNLCAEITQNSKESADLKENIVSEAIAAQLEKHRQEQEGLIRSLVHGISEDIRGERFNFVGAMQSATTVNVQMHVDEFKKQLATEVVAMTQDVGRLREERKNLENELSEMFALRAKWSAHANRTLVKATPQLQQPQPQRRPLPHPTQPQPQ